MFCTLVPLLSPADKAAGKQLVNTFQGYSDFLGSHDNLVMQLTLGSTEYPMRPVHGYSEAYFRLLRTLGIVAPQAHAIGVSKQDFDTNSFCLATDTEQVSTVSSSGVNVQGIEARCAVSGLSDNQGIPNSFRQRFLSYVLSRVYRNVCGLRNAPHLEQVSYDELLY